MCIYISIYIWLYMYIYVKKYDQIKNAFEEGRRAHTKMKLANNFSFSNSALKFLRHHSVILFHPLSTHLTIYAIWCFLRRWYVVEHHFQNELRFDKNKVCKSLIARLLKIVKSSTSIGQHFLYILNKHKNPNNVRISMHYEMKYGISSYIICLQ